MPAGEANFGPGFGIEPGTTPVATDVRSFYCQMCKIPDWFKGHKEGTCLGSAPRT